jgi:hypothetical protein
MLNDVYAHGCRSPGTSMTITMIWAAAEIIGGVHLPWCNLSPTATMRIRAFSDAAGAIQVFDSGVDLACLWPAAKLLGLLTSVTYLAPERFHWRRARRERHFILTALAFCYVAQLYLAFYNFRSTGLLLYYLWNASMIMFVAFLDAHQRAKEGACAIPCK